MPQIDGKQIKSWSVAGKQLAITHKDAVRVATTAPLPACTYVGSPTFTLTGDAVGALPAQDGITLTAGQSLFVKNQVDTTQDGPYIVTVVGDGGTAFVLTRRSDWNASAALHQGNAILVVEGDTLARQMWILTTVDAMTLDATPLSFASAIASPATRSVPTAGNKNMTAEVAAADFAKACDTAIAATPVNDGYVDVRCNGVEMLVSSGDRTGEVYFSDDAGATGKTVAAIASGDKIYLGTGRLYDLAATDKISFHYNVLQ